jgi:hypothetical protein
MHQQTSNKLTCSSRPQNDRVGCTEQTWVNWSGQFRGETTIAGFCQSPGGPTGLQDILYQEESVIRTMKSDIEGITFGLHKCLPLSMSPANLNNVCLVYSQERCRWCLGLRAAQVISIYLARAIPCSPRGQESLQSSWHTTPVSTRQSHEAVLDDPCLGTATKCQPMIKRRPFQADICQ